MRRCAMASQRWVDLWVKEEITRSALRCRRLKRTLLQIFSASASYKVMRQLGGLHNPRSEEHTSELQSLMRSSYAVFCLKKKNNAIKIHKYKEIILMYYSL